MFTNFGDKEAAASLRLIKELRGAGVAAELYPDAAKMKKQMAYANALSIPYVAIIGESELQAGTVTLKNMESGEQQTLPASAVVEALKK